MLAKPKYICTFHVRHVLYFFWIEMHIFIGLAALFALGLTWYFRIRNAAHISLSIAILNKRNTRKHPIFTIDGARIVGGSLAAAFMELGDVPSSEFVRA